MMRIIPNSIRPILFLLGLASLFALCSGAASAQAIDLQSINDIQKNKVFLPLLSASSWPKTSMSDEQDKIQTDSNSAPKLVAAQPTKIVRVRKTYMLAGQPIAQQSYERPAASSRSHNGGEAKSLNFIYTDHLGSANTLVDENGSQTNTRFLPFGEILDDERFDDGVGAITERGFTGHRENRDVGLTYMNARYYVPGIGRFASADIIVPDPTNPQQFNRYSYVVNNPLAFIDPSGHCAYATLPNGSSQRDLVNDADCWSAYDEYQAAYGHISLDDSLQYDDLKSYIDGYSDTDAQNWLTEALLTLWNAGPISRTGTDYIIDNNVEIRIVDFSWWQESMGVRWAADGAVEMRADKISWSDPVELRRLPGLIHEAKHLEQGWNIALSQLGEVQAWAIEGLVAGELGVTTHVPAEVTAWHTDPTKVNFQKARRGIIDSTPPGYLFWALDQMPYYFRGYQVNLDRLPQ